MHTHRPTPSSRLEATASYRLLPHIKILSPIAPQDVDEFKSHFAPGVIASVKDPKTGLKTAKVVNPRKDTVSREVLRNEKFKDIVELSRIRDHFICAYQRCQIPASKNRKHTR